MYGYIYTYLYNCEDHVWTKLMIYIADVIKQLMQDFTRVCIYRDTHIHFTYACVYMC